MSENRQILSVNWIPETFEEFRSAALAGRIELNIMAEQYTWLYAEIEPFRIFQTSSSYKKKLLKKMISDETIFRKVHDKGIDLVLLG